MSARKRQRQKNVSRFPGCSVIGVPERACATLTELVMQAAARPWAAGEIPFYGINRLIQPYEIPDGTF